MELSSLLVSLQCRCRKHSAFRCHGVPPYLRQCQCVQIIPTDFREKVRSSVWFLGDGFLY